MPPQFRTSGQTSSGQDTKKAPYSGQCFFSETNAVSGGFFGGSPAHKDKGKNKTRRKLLNTKNKNHQRNVQESLDQHKNTSKKTTKQKKKNKVLREMLRSPQPVHRLQEIVCFVFCFLRGLLVFAQKTKNSSFFGFLISPTPKTTRGFFGFLCKNQKPVRKQNTKKTKS